MKKINLFMFIVSLFFPFLSHAEMQIIPLNKTQDGYLEIQASINGVKAKFILDTGATGTVIGINNLNLFGINKGQEKIDGVGVGDNENGRVETFSVDITQFSIGQNQLDIQSIYSNDISGRLPPNVMGLIGYDALLDLKALLDVKNSRLLVPENQGDIKNFLSKSTTVRYEAINLYKSAMGFSFIDIKLDDNFVRLIVDSGSPELILDESALIQFGFELEDHPSAKSVVAEGIELPMKVYKNGQITIGSMTLTDDFLTTDFTALMKAVNVEGQPRLIGILGNKHLVQLNSIIDAANAKLYIKG